MPVGIVGDPRITLIRPSPLIVTASRGAPL